MGPPRRAHGAVVSAPPPSLLAGFSKEHDDEDSRFRKAPLPGSALSEARRVIECPQAPTAAFPEPLSAKTRCRDRSFEELVADLSAMHWHLQAENKQLRKYVHGSENGSDFHKPNGCRLRQEHSSEKHLQGHELRIEGQLRDDWSSPNFVEGAGGHFTVGGTSIIPRGANCQNDMPPADVTARDKGRTVLVRWEILMEGVFEKFINIQFPLRDSWNAATKISRHFLDPEDDGLFDTLAVARMPRRSTNLGSCSFSPLPNSPRFGRNIICHPHSVPRLTWTGLGMMLMGYESLKLSVQVFDLEENSFSQAMEWVGHVYWTLDIFMSFLTGTFIQGQLSFDPQVVAWAYMRSWFFFDLCIVSSNWFLLYMSTGDGRFEKLSALRYIRFMRFSRVVRLIKLFTMLPAMLAAVTSPFHLLALEIVQFLLGMIIWIHLSACGFYAVEKQHGSFPFLDSETAGERYVLSAHWAAAQLQGSTDVNPARSLGQRTYAVGVIMMSIPFCALFISRLTNILMELHELTKKNAAQLRFVRDYMTRHRISHELSVRIQKYIKWQQAMDKSKADKTDEEVLKVLPRHFKGAVLEESLSPLLLKHCLFRMFRSEYHPFFQYLCVEALSTIFAMPDEVIFHLGAVPTRAYMIEKGGVTFFQYSSIARAVLGSSGRDDTGGVHTHLREHLLKPVDIHIGSTLTEMALWTRCTHTGDLVSSTNSSMLVVDVCRFELSAGAYPSLQVKLANHAQRFAKGLNDFEGVSYDLFTSSDIASKGQLPRSKNLKRWRSGTSMM